MTADEYFAFLYAYFADSADPRYASPTDITNAMTIAQSRRPPCLSEEAQNEAQAHYAAYLLEMRYAQKSDQSAGSGNTVRREKQGNVEVEYNSATESSQVVSGPATPYASWKALNDVCTRGAIMTSGAFSSPGGPP